MSPKIKNIIIFSVVGVALVLGYIFFIKKAPTETALVSSSSSPATTDTGAVSTNANKSEMGREFLSVFLNIKNIKLNDGIFSEPSFSILKDSSITLTPDGNEGRVNPFAPIGSESMSPQILQTATQVNVVSPTEAPKSS